MTDPRPSLLREAAACASARAPLVTGRKSP